MAISLHSTIADFAFRVTFALCPTKTGQARPERGTERRSIKSADAALPFMPSMPLCGLFFLFV
jgi:hypothetical protein